jgi:hypothetical protein
MLYEFISPCMLHFPPVLHPSFNKPNNIKWSVKRFQRHFWMFQYFAEAYACTSELHTRRPLLATCDRHTLSHMYLLWVFNVEEITPEGCISKVTDLQKTKFLRLFGLTNVNDYCLYAQMQPSVPLCREASALCPSGMTHVPLLYVVRPSISDYANMLIRPSGMMPSISFCQMSQVATSLRLLRHIYAHLPSPSKRVTTIPPCRFNRSNNTYWKI